MALPLLLPVGQALADMGIGFLNKPKKGDYTPDTSYLDKYISNLRGDLASRRVERNILREGARATGDLASKQLENAEYQAHRTGTVGSGLQIAQQQKIQEQAQSAMSDITIQAKDATAQQAEQTAREINQVEMKRDQIESEARAQYRRAKNQWENDMIGRGIKGAVNVAGAAITSAATKAAEMNDAAAIANANGLADAPALDVPEMGQDISPSQWNSALDYRPEDYRSDIDYGTINGAKQLLKETGASSPSVAMQALGITQDKQKGIAFRDAMIAGMGLTGSAAVQEIINNKNLSPQQQWQVIEKTEEYQFNNNVYGVLDDMFKDKVSMSYTEAYEELTARGMSSEQASKGAGEIADLGNRIDSGELNDIFAAEQAGLEISGETIPSQGYINKVTNTNPSAGLKLQLEYNEALAKEVAGTKGQAKTDMVSELKYGLLESASSGNYTSQEYSRNFSLTARAIEMTDTQFRINMNAAQTAYDSKEKEQTETDIAMSKYENVGTQLYFLQDSVKESIDNKMASYKTIQGIPEMNAEMNKYTEFFNKFDELEETLASGSTDPNEVSRKIRSAIYSIPDETVKTISEGADYMTTLGFDIETATLLKTQRTISGMRRQLFNMYSKYWVDMVGTGKFDNFKAKEPEEKKVSYEDFQ